MNKQPRRYRAAAYFETYCHADFFATSQQDAEERIWDLLDGFRDDDTSETRITEIAEVSADDPQFEPFKIPDSSLES